MTQNADNRIDTAALAVLAILQTLMLAALYTRTEPHPPFTVPPFALGPFLSSAIAIAVAALILGSTTTRSGRVATLVTVLAALVSFGPHKWLTSGIGEIWPAIGLAEFALVVLAVRLAIAWRQTGSMASAGTG